MKRIKVLILAIGFTAAVAMAAETNVTSVNVVGYVKLDVASGLTQFALNWKGLGANATISVQDIFDPAVLKGGLDFGQGDNIYIWDPQALPAAKYIQLYLYDSGGAYPAYDGLWYTFPGGVEATNMIRAGEAFWLRHKAAATNAVVSGQVPTSPSNTVSFGQGLTMFGSAYSAALNIASQDWAQCYGGLDFGQGDNIYIWDPKALPAAKYIQLYLYDSGGAYPAYDGKWYTFPGGVEYTDSLPLGQGAWFKHKVASPGVWTENKPYSL